MGGRSFVPLSAENRAAAGVAAGDEVDVEIAVDTAPRVTTVPDDLASALDAEPGARAFFETLSYSDRRFHVEPVTGAKTAETRARRVTKVVDAMRERRVR